MNGSLGRVTGFCTMKDAQQQGVGLGLPGDWTAWLEAKSKRSLYKYPSILFTSPDTKWPVVTFSATSGQGSMLCVPNAFEAINAEGEIEATREQVS